MKKLKVLLSAVLTCVLALSVAGCATDDAPADVIVPQSLSVNTEAAKVEYAVGEDYSSEGLVVTLNEFNQTQNVSAGSRQIALTDSNLTIDSSDYNKNAGGTYTIEVSYTVGETTVETSYDVRVVVTEELQSITLNTQDVKTRFYYNDEFTSDGLVVTASVLSSDSTTPETRNVTEDAVIDYSEYNNSEAGTYTIKVSYTLDSVTKEAEYTVDVSPVGVDVRLKAEYQNVINLSSELTAADLSGYAGMIEVRRPEADGTVDLESAPLGADEYTTELYLNDSLVEETQLANLGSGAYQIWVTLDDTHASGYEFEGFVIIYVVDALQSITFNADAPGTLTTQEEGADEISSTWTFTANYVSGHTEPLTAEDVEISGLDTNTPTQAGSATVVYTTVNSMGQTMSAQAVVSYTITEKTVAPGGETNTYTLNISELATAVGGTDTTQDLKLALTQEHFNTASNSFLTITNPGTSDVYRSKYECIELKDGLLSVTFEGTGTLTIAVRSTGTSNISDIGLKGPDGSWVPATYDTENANVVAVAEGYYTVTGGDYIPLTFNITTGGTYTIESNISGNNGRAVRINAITMVDNVPAAATEHTSTFSLPELKEALGGATVVDKTALTADAFTGSNAFITATIADPGKDVYRIQASYDCIEINKGTLAVTFTGTGTLTITARSTSGKNVSDIGLKSQDGSYVAATYDESNTNIVAVAGGYYTVTGNDFIAMTFEITQPGTYTIVSNISGTNSRAVRIGAITMVDVY